MRHITQLVPIAAVSLLIVGCVYVEQHPEDSEGFEAGTVVNVGPDEELCDHPDAVAGAHAVERMTLEVDCVVATESASSLVDCDALRLELEHADGTNIYYDGDEVLEASLQWPYYPFEEGVDPQVLLTVKPVGEPAHLADEHYPLVWLEIPEEQFSSPSVELADLTDEADANCWDDRQCGGLLLRALQGPSNAPTGDYVLATGAGGELTVEVARLEPEGRVRLSLVREEVAATAAYGVAVCPDGRVWHVPDEE